MIHASLDLTGISVMFLTCIYKVAVAAALSTNPTNYGRIPHDVVEGMVHNTIVDSNILPLLDKRRNGGHDDGVRKELTCIEYDHACACMFVSNDWLGMHPQFPDQYFK